MLVIVALSFQLTICLLLYLKSLIDLLQTSVKCLLIAKTLLFATTEVLGLNVTPKMEMIICLSMA